MRIPVTVVAALCPNETPLMNFTARIRRAPLLGAKASEQFGNSDPDCTLFQTFFFTSEGRKEFQSLK